MKNRPPRFIKGKLTEDSISSHLIKLSWPMLLGRLNFIAFNIVDTFFIAQLGTKQLAAMSFTFPAVMIIGSVAMGLGNASGLVIARVIGRGDRHQIQRRITDNLLLSLVIGIILVLIALVTIDPFFSLLGAKPEIINLIREYIPIIYIGSIFSLVTLTANNAIRASGNTLLPSVLMIFSTLINFVLDPLFIFGWGIFPRLELKGAAIATLIAQAIALILFLIILDREKNIVFNIPKFKELLKSWKNSLHLAIPIIATNAIKPLSTAIIIGTIAVYGSSAIAGFGIISRVEGIVLIVFSAVSTSVGLIVGQNFGAGKLLRVNKTFSLGSQFCLLWGIFMAIILALFSGNIAAIFNNNPEVISVASTYFKIVPISYPALGILIISTAIFNGTAKPLPPVIMTLTKTFAIYLPLAAVGSKLLGIQGVFIAICLSNLLIGILSFTWNKISLNLVAEKKSISRKFADRAN